MVKCYEFRCDYGDGCGMHEHESHEHLGADYVLASDYVALEAERDLYKPYYDAVIDMAVVNWTLDGLSTRDAYHAIQRLILQHAQDACDPQLNETLAKMQARIAELEHMLDKIKAIEEPISPCPCKPMRWRDCHCGAYRSGGFHTNQIDEYASAMEVWDQVRAIVDARDA